MNKNSNIKFRLEVWDRYVVFQVLEMNKKFVRKSTDTTMNTYRAVNGFLVVSNIYPKLTQNGVGVFGVGKQYDQSICSFELKSNKHARAYADKLINALSDWSKNWSGFKTYDVFHKLEYKNPSIYEL